MTQLEQKPEITYLKNYTSPAFLVEEIALHFDLGEESTQVKSRLKIQRNPESHHAQNILILNGEELTLQSIRLNDQELEKSQYEVTAETLVIYEVPATFTLEIHTTINPDKNLALSGLYRSKVNFCTQCEAQGFRRITYFLDRPDVLARYTTTIVADATRYPFLLSNGNLVESRQLEDGRHLVTWHDPFKKPCYLFALVAGDFDLLADEFQTQSGRRVAVQLYVEKGYVDQSHHAMQAVKQAMQWDEKNYGREYDLDVYMIVAIHDFNMGAMENKGLNIFNTKYILAKPQTATDMDYMNIASVIAHEYFHNWTGNRVTCRDWFQLSLKEGLTIFRDQSFSEDLFSAACSRIREVKNLREVQFIEDAGPLAHPVRPDSYIEINNFYTSTVYEKGAEVLRMIQTILGKTVFRQAMDRYFEKFDGQAVTIEDFVANMEAIAGVDLQQFRLWYSQAGTPVVAVTEDYDATEQTYTLEFRQSCPPTPGQPHKAAMVIPIRMALLNEEGKPLALHLEDRAVVDETVIVLKNNYERYQFKQIASRPVPSLLRYFSAPIKCHFAYADEDLRFLFQHDQDAFNRWDAGQKYAERVLLQLVRDEQQGKPLHVPAEFIDDFRVLLTKSLQKEATQDKYLYALMLTLPSEKYLGEQMEVIDVDAIHYVREFVACELAQQLRALFLAVYQHHHHGEEGYQFTMQQVGERQLKNTSLYYLMLLRDEAIHKEIGLRQFQSSLVLNMTDTIPALSALANVDSPLRESALAEFYAAWKKDNLVIDKWFSIQALTKLPNTLAQVKKLLRHEAFELKNPNRVYALIGAFCQQNAVRFHDKSGDGYAFLKECVLQLDKFNPQVAARMVKPLTVWHRYDKDRQKLICEQLRAILADKQLSNDTYEMVSKSLGEHQ